jgi:hypothetical protein
MHGTPPSKPVRSRRWRSPAVAAMATAGLLIAAQPALAAGKPTHWKMATGTHYKIASATGSVPHEIPATGGESSVTGGALFGGSGGLTADTHKLGRSLAIVRIYDYIGDSFPGPDRKYLAAGSTVLVSLDSKRTSYSDIAAGHQDKAITAFLTEVNQAAVRYHLPAIYVSFEHEPDSAKHHSLGTPAEFVKAWDHIHQLATSHHLNWKAGGRLHWIWIVIHSAFTKGLASKYFPGTSEVAGVGVDGFNSLTCRLASPKGASSHQRSLFTPAAVFDPAISFARSKGGLPVFIAEWGTDGSSATQTTFIRQMQSYVASNPEIAAAMYWDDNGHTCNYSLGHTPAALAALATMGHSRALQGHIAGSVRTCAAWSGTGTTADGSAGKRVHVCSFRITPPGAGCWRAVPMTSQSGPACAAIFRMAAKPVGKSSH